MIACFFGSRTWCDAQAVARVVNELLLEGDGSLVLVHGGARGADTLAHEAARALGLIPTVVEAQWSTHAAAGPVPCRCTGPTRCRAAGVRRNQLLIDEHLVPALSAGELVVARGFRMPGDSPGTDDMVRRLRAANITGKVLRAR